MTVWGLKMGLKVNSFYWLKTLSLLLLICAVLLVPRVQAEVITMPIKRAIATQPITELEIIAMINSIFDGDVLAVKKQATHLTPDCHFVKFLEARGEFQMIEVGCYAANTLRSH